MEDYIILGILVFVLFYLFMNISLHESFRVHYNKMSNSKKLKNITKSLSLTKKLNNIQLNSIER